MAPSRRRGFFSSECARISQPAPLRLRETPILKLLGCSTRIFELAHRDVTPSSIDLAIDVPVAVHVGEIPLTVGARSRLPLHCPGGLVSCFDIG